MKTEAARGGEFNRGSAQQFGGYDLTNQDVVGKYGEDLRLSNFTGAEMRKASLKARRAGASNPIHGFTRRRVRSFDSCEI